MRLTENQLRNIIRKNLLTEGMLTPANIKKLGLKIVGEYYPGGLNLAVTDSGGWIVSLVITYDESGDYFYIDMKERGGNEAKLKEELDKMGTVEYVRFSPTTTEQLVEIG